jgi:hypothetical protein
MRKAEEISSTISQLGSRIDVSITDLLLDEENPRFSESLSGNKQLRIAQIIEMGFEAFAVAESMCRYGYFPSEPLIVMASAAVPGKFVVLEGNRRVTALLGLTDVTVRKSFASSERWDALARSCSISASSQVPAVLVESREDCAPVIGFRHISGILSWSPYAQARYIASLVDGRGLSFSQVAEMVGKRRGDVADLYRDQAIADQARKLGIDTGGLEQTFSLLTVAMGTTKLREFVGAPMGAHTTSGVEPIPEEKRKQLKEALGWIYGTATTAPVISDSRQIAKLGNVISSPDGLKAIRAGKSLEEASQVIQDAVADPLKRLILQLKTANNALVATLDVISEFAEDADVRDLYETILETLGSIGSVIESE